ncbi:MAG TPA: hypothetical protein VHC96_11215 [Puia sp.]|nr:hypothetical protein [Puia sp.]
MKAIFVLLLLPLQLFSQDLSGIWVGTIATTETQMPFELAINQDMTGYSMITFVFKGAEKTAVKKINLIRKDSTFTISDDKVIYNNFETRSRSIKTFCELSIKMVDSTMVLSGPFHTRTRDLRAGDQDLATGTITLQKQNNRVQTKLISKLDSLKLSNTLVFSNPKATINEPPVVAVYEKISPAVAGNSETHKSDSVKLSTPLASSGPKTIIKDSPVAAASEKATPAVTGNSEKDLTAVKVQQQVSAGKGRPDSVKLSTPLASSGPKTIIKDSPVVAASGKATPAVAGNPVKDLTAVKVQQQVSSEKGKNESSGYAPNNITAAPAIPTSPKIITAAAEITSRKTEVIRTIDFKSDSLTLILYDNGVVDGDTVSVVLNDEVIIPKLGLTDQAYRKVIKIPPGLGDSLQLVIYAENLGSIPPNSGLLIIEDGDDRQKVGFEGDMKKSSAVKLIRRR